MVVASHWSLKLLPDSALSVGLMKTN